MVGCTYTYVGRVSAFKYLGMWFDEAYVEETC